MKRIFALLFCIALGAAANARDARVMVPKGDFSMGAQFAHMRLNSDNSEIMLLLNPINAEGKISQVAPFFEYCYRDDCSFGSRLQYVSADAVLDKLTLDLLNDGLSFDVSDLSTRKRSFGLCVFHRNYFALDERSRVAVISEVSLAYTGGRTDFDITQPGADYSTSRKLNFAFSPGLVYYVMNNVSAMFTLSMANVSYNTVKCYTDGAETGTRAKFAGRFGVDLTGMNFGVAFHF